MQRGFVKRAKQLRVGAFIPLRYSLLESPLAVCFRDRCRILPAETCTAVVRMPCQTLQFLDRKISEGICSDHMAYFGN